MTRFLIGLLLGLLLGIGGTAAFLITAGGGDYLVVSSPRVRELEASLKNVEQDRAWLRERLTEANDALAKLESRFSGLSARFEALSDQVAQSGGAAQGAAPGAAAPGAAADTVEQQAVEPSPAAPQADEPPAEQEPAEQEPAATP